MSFNPKHQTILFLPKDVFESFIVLAMVGFKKKAIVAYEYDLDEVPDCVKFYSKILNKPSLLDSEVIIAGGVQPCLMYMDKRYPVPVLYPAGSADFGLKLNLFEVLSDRFESILKVDRKISTKKSKDMLMDFSRIAEDLLSTSCIHYNSKEPSFIDGFFVALILYLSDLKFDLTIFKGCPLFTAYLVQLARLESFQKCKEALEESRPSKPFWEIPGFNMENFK